MPIPAPNEEQARAALAIAARRHGITLGPEEDLTIEHLRYILAAEKHPYIRAGIALKLADIVHPDEALAAIQSLRHLDTVEDEQTARDDIKSALDALRDQVKAGTGKEKIAAAKELLKIHLGSNSRMSLKVAPMKQREEKGKQHTDLLRRAEAIEVKAVEPDQQDSP